MRGSAALLVCALALVAAAPTHADEAEQSVGLFMQSCVRFAGDTAGLRRWATETGLKPLPPGGQAAFLQNQPGIAYDATNAEGKFVMASGEAGSCFVVAEKADATQLTNDLEQALQQAGLAFTAGAETVDPADKNLRSREFRIRKAGHGWRIVLSTGRADSGAHPMLAIAPE
ncbi:MAG: hypothetical protein J0H14_03720 [Alphaproteobacteria bacterium]|nr:hypothetical protein [Alphaproteobacteria bacterium]